MRPWPSSAMAMYSPIPDPAPAHTTSTVSDWHRTSTWDRLAVQEPVEKERVMLTDNRLANHWFIYAKDQTQSLPRGIRMDYI